MTGVAIIIPAYNACDFLEETVRSAANQTVGKVEVIIVNDGSKDGTLDLANSLSKKLSNVTVINKPNGGVSSARNTGFNHTKAEFVAFLDADDIIHPDAIERKLTLFNDPNVGLVHGNLELIDADSKPTGVIMRGKSGWVLDDLLEWKGTVIPTPSSILVKRTVIEKVGGFNESLSNNADQEFFFRVTKHYKVGQVDSVLGGYRVHENQMHNNIPLLDSDSKKAFALAQDHGLFKSSGFRRRCFAKMYLILGNCWWKDARKPFLAFRYYCKALMLYPLIFFRYKE